MAPESVIVNCARIDKPDLAAIDCLARTQLAERRCGRDVRLRSANADLLELICLAGLDGVLCVEVKRQPEEGEQLGGVEEEGELPDPSV